MDTALATPRTGTQCNGTAAGLDPQHVLASQLDCMRGWLPPHVQGLAGDHTVTLDLAGRRDNQLLPAFALWARHTNHNVGAVGQPLEQPRLGGANTVIPQTVAVAPVCKVATATTTIAQ